MQSSIIGTKNVDRIVYQPIRDEVIVNEQVVERKVFQDKIVERPVHVEYPKYVEREVINYQDVPIEKIVDVPYHVDQIVEKKVEMEVLVENEVVTQVEEEV